MKTFFLAILLIITCNAFAQQHQIDSLEYALQSADKKDASLILSQLSALYQNIDINKSVGYDLQILEIARQDNNLYSESTALNNLAIDHYFLGEYASALDYLEKSLEIREKLKDTVQIVKTLNNLGVISQVSGNYDKALHYLQKSLEFKQTLGDTISIAKTLNNIGVIYKDALQYEDAKGFLAQALEYYQKLGDEPGIAAAYNNLGQVYSKQKYQDSALDYYRKSLVLKRKIDDKRGIGNTLNNIGEIFSKKNEVDEAMKYFNEARQIREDVGDKFGLSSTLNHLADLYRKNNDFEQAKEYYAQSLEIAVKENLLGIMQRNYDGLFRLYDSTSMPDKALHYHKLLSLVKDTIYNQDLKKQIAGLQVKYATEKTEKENEILRHKNNIQELKISLYRERQILLSIALILILVLSAIIILWLRYRNHRRLSSKLQQLNAELESRVKKRTGELEQANATKDQLFSIIAHDLKSPFNALLGFVDILSTDYDTLEPDEKKQIIGYLKDSTENVYKLLENLLAWTSSQRGKIILMPTEINVNEIISHVMDTSYFQAERKNIRLHIDTGANKKAYADEETVKITIRNLLSNAIKFTPDGGGITINTQIVLQNGTEEFVISVVDSGVGIPAAQLETLFTSSGKIKTNGTNKEPGTGLGLMICKEFAELNNGRIWAESEEGKGSTFSFSLPISR